MAHTKWTEEQRQAARERLLKRMTPEWRQQQSERGKQRRHTEEEKRKISEAHRGMKASSEARAKMSAAKKGKPASELTRQGLLKGAKKPRTTETRQRMSEARKKLLADPVVRHAQTERVRRAWAAMTREQRQEISKKGRLACLEAVRLREPTSIEKMVANVLRSMSVHFETQVLFTYYIADIFLPDYHTIIECDGDYWHSTPKMKAHDAKRDRWFVKHGIKVIRMKECDIRADVKTIVQEGLKGILWPS